MKNILLGLTFSIVAGIGAQTYFEDDFESNLTNWTLVDKDGDGFNWEIYDSPTPQGKVAVSASYDNDSYSALFPDNWMISPSIDLTNATETTIFSWKAYGQDQNWANENYSVYVSIVGDVEDASNATLAENMMNEGSKFNEVIGSTNSVYAHRSIDISEFNGEVIYIAFRHHSSSDQYMLNIDDVKVAGGIENDLAIISLNVDKTMTGNRTFSILVRNYGMSNISNFNFDYSVGGFSASESVTGLDLNFGDEHTFTFEHTINEAGTKSVVATITNEDLDMSNNSITLSFNFNPLIPQYINTDIHGNEFNLHDRLAGGQTIILDFMASWCPPCLSSTPALSELIQNNGSGEETVEALAITVEEEDDVSAMLELNWNGGFYEYPKFAYSAANRNQYVHYARDLELNLDGYIPFFLMICPNEENPENSTIKKYDTGYTQGMFSAYQTALNQCVSGATDLVKIQKSDFALNVYPNPANQLLNIEFNIEAVNDVEISIINALGQLVITKETGKTSGVQTTQVDVSSLENGMYFLKMKTDFGEQTVRFSKL